MGVCCISSLDEHPNPRRESELIERGIDERSLISVLEVPKYRVLKVLGRGKYGKVLLVRKMDTQELLAMKVIRKSDVEKFNQYEHTLTERSILEENASPFLIGLKYAFQSDSKLYLAMEYMPGGDLFFHLKRARSFTESKARFYIAEIILAIEYLHERNIVYRDLKPENVLLGLDGHIKLSDFGLSKYLDGKRTHSTCGTVEYMAPEMFLPEGYSTEVDMWGIGALLFLMVIGRPPFHSTSRQEVIENKVRNDVQISGRLSEILQDLLARLLARKPEERLCHFVELKSHPFFKKVDWDRLSKKQVKAPFKPSARRGDDVSYFDAEFTSEPAIDDDAENCVIEEHPYPHFDFDHSRVEDES